MSMLRALSRNEHNYKRNGLYRRLGVLSAKEGTHLQYIEFDENADRLFSGLYVIEVGEKAYAYLQDCTRWRWNSLVKVSKFFQSKPCSYGKPDKELNKRLNYNYYSEGNY